MSGRKLTSPLAVYSYSLKDCLRGDCKEGGTSDLVKYNNSYWVCANCSVNAALHTLGTTCIIGDQNNAPTATIRKQFIAKGGRIKISQARVVSP